MPLVESLRFAVMGTTAHIAVIDGPLGLAAHAGRRLAELEGRWSRFRPDSDISRLNRRAGAAVGVHGDTVALLRHAADAWLRTGGRFDPTVHDALVALGYDRTFRAVDDSDLPYDPAPAPGCAGIVIDVDLSTITLPEHVHLDLGGIAKGFAADVVVEELRALGAAGALVDLGGDVRVGGRSPDTVSWNIAIEHPLDVVRDLAFVSLASGQDAAMTTSSTLGRRWRRGHEAVHHLVDPRTGRPHDTGIVSVTVLGTNGWITDVATKVLLDGRRWPDGLGPEPPSVRVHADGRVERRAGIDAYLHNPVPACVTARDDKEAVPCTLR